MQVLEWDSRLKRMILEDHLVPHAFQLHIPQVSCKGGYTGPAVGDRQMTHAWFEVTTEPRTTKVGEQHLHLIGNMLCFPDLLCGSAAAYLTILHNS